MNKEFGSLERLDLREVWRKEPSEFTPWLANNLTSLGRALGMDLELISREVAVGDFSLDLLARDVGRDRLVVVENQLDRTNHDHLGKLLTYAAGNNAAVVIWVAAEIREEHRQALDWLNQHTDSDIEFYGVVVELLRIDDSRPAYNFRAVALPNEWRKTNITGRQTTEKGEAYRDFFQQLIDELREQHKFTGARAAQPQSWYGFAAGTSGVRYVAAFTQAGRFKAEVYVDRGDAAQNKALFDQLAQDKASIESQFGEPLEWERLDQKQACRVVISRPGRIDEPPDSLVDVRKWAIEKLVKLKKVFGPRLSKLAE
ncbi:MAG: DUF4268 domain-containing protein [Acidobacteria bacterium]|nr:DUF4268 domain-containing protein [Acidobacteriota bacterium]